MNKADILTLYDYNYWANERVLRAAEKVRAGQFTAPARLSHGSLRGALVHVLAAEVVWRLRCQEGLSPSSLPAASEFPTIESLRSRWRDEEQAMRGYLAGLTDDRLNGVVRYTTTKGVRHENTLWHLLAHVVNHGTQFRAEAAVALTECGHSPGDLDMLAFFRERDR
ncbi:MAG: DinB family protein [Chloroflexi bacterium]|nr:DinB family protein [Chloroflexota bacterium]